MGQQHSGDCEACSTTAELLAELLAEVRATRDEQRALHARVDAAVAAMPPAPALADIVEQEVRRRLSPPPPPELVELLPRVYAGLGDKTWCVRDLVAATLVHPGRANAVGRALSDLINGDLKGECAGFRVHCITAGKGRKSNLGVVRWLSRVGDDDPSSSLGKADTMRALEHAWRSR